VALKPYKYNPSFLPHPKPKHKERSPQLLIIMATIIQNIIVRRLSKDLEAMKHTSVTSETSTSCTCALQPPSLNHPLRKEIEVLANLKTTQNKKMTAVWGIY